MEKNNTCQISYDYLVPAKQLFVSYQKNIILLGFLFLSIVSFSQEKNFTLSYTNVPVETIIGEIENTSSYKFVYSKELVDVKRKVSINVKDKTIDSVLESIFGSTETDFKIQGNQIVISPKNVLNSKAQVRPQKITGKVTDATNFGLPGVNVMEKGTTNGTVTDGQGNYSLELISEATSLQFSYIGYLTEEMDIGNRSKIDLVLVEDLMEIDEVVVIGYGTRKKSDLTGSVISVSKDRLENLPSTNILESMQGAVAGVNISSGNSRPGTEPEIYIRGINSITANNGPLVVVDGVPGTGLSNINQNDIESMEILKDASAAAIYGARGSNGVILVTTKRGKGKPKISYNGYVGIKSITNKLDLMNGATHMQQKMRAYELGGYPSDTADVYTVEEYGNIRNGVETDWQEEYLRNAIVQEHQLSVSAGTDKTNYYLSTSYTDHEHILQNFNYKRLGLRFNIDQKIGDWLRIGNSLNLTQSKESGVSGNLKNATLMTPWNSPYDEDGELIMFPANNNFIGNPIAERNTVVDNNNYQIFNNLFALVNLPIEGLTYRINLGVDIRNVKDNQYQGRNTPLGFNANGIGEIGTMFKKNWLVENIVNYDHTFNEVHNVKFTGLYSSQEFNSETSYVSAYDFPVDDILYNNLSAANNYDAPASSAIKSNLLSQMVRLSYNYDQRYYITGTVRRDGYSAFGVNNKYGVFPSVALSWKISEEQFMQTIDFVSLLKLRLSYGENGNQAVSPYSSIANVVTGSSEEPENDGSYAYIYGQDIYYGYILAKMANKDLSWETTRSFNAALDFGLFSGRVKGSFEYYNSNTSDLLLERGISWVNGYNNVMSNIGKTHNHGFEATINTYNIDNGQGNFQWNTNFNLTYNKNRIVDLYGDGKDDLGNEWFIDEPIDVIFDYVFDGIVQEDEDMSETAQPTAMPGEVKVKDLNENGIIDPEDRSIVGVTRPDYIFGLTNTFHYKGFDLNIFVQGVYGITKKNDILGNSGSAGNNNLDVEWWTPETPSDQYPTLRQGKVTSYWSAFQYESADYIRIRDISVGYNFPDHWLSKVKVDKLRMYVSGRNLFTFSNWKGLDPETGSYKNPNTKSITFGLNLTL